MRQPPPTAVMVKTRRMIDTMKGAKLPAAAPGLPTLSTEVLPWPMRQEKPLLRNVKLNLSLHL